MPANRVQLERVAIEVAPNGASCSHLGTGGFASTFRIQTADGDDYALKIVDAAQSGVERTDRELSALERVNHPNIVGYRDAGTQVFEGVTYRWLKMDFVVGDTLRNVIDGGRNFGLIEAVDLVRQAVAGAAALWDARTAHRDLTPNNIMITPAGDLVIVDL
ncbi:MAG: protein kinase domain-containing protein, partial [Leucobacter sp.]